MPSENERPDMEEQITPKSTEGKKSEVRSQRSDSDAVASESGDAAGAEAAVEPEAAVETKPDETVAKSEPAEPAAESADSEEKPEEKSEVRSEKSEAEAEDMSNPSAPLRDQNAEEKSEVRAQKSDANPIASEQKAEEPVMEEVPASDSPGTEEEKSEVRVEKSEPRAESPEGPSEEATTEEAPASDSPEKGEEKSEVGVEKSESRADIPEGPSEEAKTEEAPASDSPEKEESPKTEDAPAIDIDAERSLEALMARAEEIAADKSRREEILEGALVEQMIAMLNAYEAEENLLAQGPKVALVRRSFDAINKIATVPTAIADSFREAMGNYHHKRADLLAELEVKKAENSEKKRALLEDLKVVVEKKDAQLINEVRDIQKHWAGIGHVKKADMAELYKEYRHLLDAFFEERKDYLEMLDYDHKINLAKKEALIKQAKTLLPPEADRENPDIWKEKMDQLSEIQQLWKSYGHVPREDMERINTGYRETVDNFFEVRQQFVEVQDHLREDNGQAKEALLENMQPYLTFSSTKPTEWNEASKAVREFQDAWKKIGQAPRKVNAELWSRYRELCKTFFDTKNKFFKELDEVRSENLVRKRELVEKAEALVGNTDWDKTSQELKALQAEWKKVGPIPGRHSNKLWNRFRAACDDFFNSRRESHGDEDSNLKAKQSLIEEVKALASEKLNASQLVDKVKTFQNQWKGIGRVPFKEKDRVWEEFRGEIDKLFDGLSLHKDELRTLKLKSSIESITDEDGRSKNIRFKLSKLRARISRAQEKADQYGFNIQIISKGKSGDPLRAQIQNEIDKELRIVEDLKKEIKTLNELLKAEKKKSEVRAQKSDSEASDTTAESEPVEKAAEATAEVEAAVEATAEVEAADPAAESETAEAPAESADSEEKKD